MPKPIQAIRQWVAWSRYMENGTMIRPPMETAAELMLMAVARRRLNHRDINAAVLVLAGPVCAMDTTTPNMNAKKRMWKVRASMAVPFRAATFVPMFAPFSVAMAPFFLFLHGLWLTVIIMAVPSLVTPLVNHVPFRI